MRSSTYSFRLRPSPPRRCQDVLGLQPSSTARPSKAPDSGWVCEKTWGSIPVCMSISVSQSLRLAEGGGGGRRTPSGSKPCVMKPFYSRLFCLLLLLLLPICFFPHVPPAFFHILLIASPPPRRKTSDLIGAPISKHFDNGLLPQNFTSFLCVPP